jgi:hypothetical protein
LAQKGIEVFSTEEDSPSPRGDNSKRVKIHRIFKKNSSFSKAAIQNQLNLVQIILV